MQIIPVVDLMQGQVVRAVRGDRRAYRPIVSALCGSSDPVTVARILSTHCAAPALYVADLDALTGEAPQSAVIAALVRALPMLEIWIDAGFAARVAFERLQAAVGAGAERLRPVYGSESLRPATGLGACFDPADGNALLSLDRRDGQRLDPAGCWDQPAAWPKRVIVMTLERVGADAGPDLDTLAAVCARAPAAALIGAGGIRDAADLELAAAAGASAWLVASALHDRRLPPAP